MNDGSPYCKVYVQGAASASTLKAQLAALTQGRVQRRNVSAPPLDIDVFDQARHAPTDAGDNFVQWPHYLEIGAADAEVGFTTWLAALASLLNGMQARGLRVVAACDFETELAAAMRAGAC